jgi:hypothetical protein
VYLLNDQNWLRQPQVTNLQTNLGQNHVAMTQLLSGYVQLFRFDAR